MSRRLHLPLFLLAMVGAIAIKVAVNEARQLTETTFSAQVNYNLPEGTMILEPVRQIEVRLQGERSEIATLTPFNVQVEVSLRAEELGRIDITEEQLVVRGPGEFEVVSVEPNFFTLTVEKVERRTLPVRVELTGEPAAGAVPGIPRVAPSSAQVEGPSSRVRRLTEVQAPVSLVGHGITFEQDVSVVSPDSLVRIVEPRQVTVAIPMTVPGSEPSLEPLSGGLAGDAPDQRSEIP